MAEASPSHAWYVGYGSNLNPCRLQCYLDGTTPIGRTKAQDGCRNSSPPTSVKPIQIGGSLYFTEKAPTWHDSSVAFWRDSGPQQSGVRATAYRLTFDQVVDLILQENDKDPNGNPKDLPKIVEVLNHLQVESACEFSPKGWYRRLIRLAQIQNGEPVFTCTASPTPAKSPRVPKEEYLQHLRLGLMSVHGMSEGEISQYLRDCGGIE